MGLFLGLAASLKVPERWRARAAVGLGLGMLLVLVAVAWGAVALWFGQHDAKAVSTDRAASNAEVLGRVVDVDRAAGAAKDQRDAANLANQSDLQEKADAAAANDTSPLDALFNELR